MREGEKEYTRAFMVCLHPFQTSTPTQTKLTFPIKLFFNRRKYENWVITSCPLQDIFIYPASLHYQTVSEPIQTYTNTRNTSIPPVVLSFQAEFVNKFKLMEDMCLLLFCPYQIQPFSVGEGQDLTSSRRM